MKFELHPQLAKDCAHVCDLSVCRVLLMNNSQFPWLILVPMREGIREITELSEQDYKTAMDEVRFCAAQFLRSTNAFKMNVAALGNMVPQLHIHIIARFENDAAWPNPVWNSGVATTPYDAGTLVKNTAEIRAILG
jgi:diadenosine tetraphosphate (Ap4A) HIT family hydrolase